MTVTTQAIGSGRPLFILPEGRFFGALTQSIVPVIQMKAKAK